MDGRKLSTAEADELLGHIRRVTAKDVLPRHLRTLRDRFVDVTNIAFAAKTPVLEGQRQYTGTTAEVFQALDDIDHLIGECHARIGNLTLGTMNEVIGSVREICKRPEIPEAGAIVSMKPNEDADMGSADGAPRVVLGTVPDQSHGIPSPVPTIAMAVSANGEGEEKELPKNLDAELISFAEEHGIVTRSMTMEYPLDTLQFLASIDGHVLIRGETGTGKELFSRALHAASKRSKGPLVVVDGAAIDTHFIKDELVGHERGAFTGADKKKEGKLETAGKGAIFLDEIGRWNLEVQGILLSILEGKPIERLGSNGTEVIPFNARVIAATNADLEDLVNKGLFLEDLYYRLQRMRIDLPTLRERGHADIEALVEHFLKLACKQDGMQSNVVLDSLALGALKEYEWPGNVRQLKHVIEQALVNAHRERVRQMRLAREKPKEGAEIEISVHHVTEALKPYKRLQPRQKPDEAGSITGTDPA